MSLSAVQKNARINISNSSRTATRNGTGVAGSWHSGRTASGFNIGKIYWEVTIDVASIPGQTPMVGVVTAAYAGFADGNYIGIDNEGIAAHQGNIYYTNTGTSGGFGPIGAEAQGRTYGVLVDRKSNTIQWALVDLDPANPPWSLWIALSSGITVGEAVYPAYGFAGLNDQVTFNFGATPFIIKQMPEGSESFDGTRFWYDTLVTASDLAGLLEPPKPPMPNVRLTNPDGTPTKAYHDFLTKQYEYERAVRGLVE